MVIVLTQNTYMCIFSVQTIKKYYYTEVWRNVFEYYFDYVNLVFKQLEAMLEASCVEEN